MVNEIVLNTRFRYKYLLIVVIICVASFILALQYSTARTPFSQVLPVWRESTLSTPSKAGFLGWGLDIPHNNAKKDHLDISYVEDNLESLNQKNPQLIQYTRVRHLTPPSKRPYNLKGRGNFSDFYSRWIADVFKNQRGGVFIEAGANNGESGSHTLYLERELGWTGLLVECNPTVVPFLRSKHRKAWIADVCLSPTAHAATFNFSNPEQRTPAGAIGKALDGHTLKTKWSYFDVHAIPLYTLLAGAGLKHVDFFSLDIQGPELKVLKNFPFELVTFNVLLIEIYFYGPQELKELDTLMKSNGYVYLKKVQIDIIYVHKNFKDSIPPNM